MRAALTPLAALLALLSVWAPRPADAAEHSISYSLWVVSGDSVLMRYTLPQEELRYLVPAGWPSPVTAAVASYLLERITVQSSAGPCPAIDQGYDIGRVDPLAAAPGLYSFEILYRCSDPRGLTLSNTALFERAAHTDFARVQVNGSDFVPVLFTAGRQQLLLPDAAPPPRASAASYLRLGGAHVLHDLEGACFLIALALLVTRREEFAYLMAGLALGYVAATVLAAVNLALLRPAAGEAWTGLLVACVAAAAVVPHGQAAHRLPLAAAAGLALLAGIAALLHQPQAALLLAGAALFSGGFLTWSAAQRRLAAAVALAHDTVRGGGWLRAADGLAHPGDRGADAGGGPCGIQRGRAAGGWVARRRRGRCDRAPQAQPGRRLGCARGGPVSGGARGTGDVLAGQPSRTSLN